MIQIGQIIREARLQLDLLQADVAEYTGVSVRSLIQIEKGTGNPTYKQLEKIMDFLGLEIRVEAINR